MKSFDYIIIGTGSAGCVLANRLSTNPEHKVLVLEAGRKDDTWKVQMPAALTYNLMDDKYNWYYQTEPQEHMNNRRCYWPRGKVWGGGSSLNAMVYVRGHAEDYNRWQQEGADGWSYADVLPYFRKSETFELGGDNYRGDNGPLKVSRGKIKNPLYEAFIRAGQQAGYPYTEDMNGYQQEGVGWMDMTIHKGQRWSTAKGYLRPALERSNLSAETGALVTRILFEGTKAVGVEYVQNGQTVQVKAEKEVILSGGAINSPQLLMLSGIGPADELKKHGIDVVADLPGVGQNLQDHLEIYVQQACTQPITLFKATKLHNMAMMGAQWFMTHTGWCATAHLEAGGFVRRNDEVEHPDIQFHFLPGLVNDHGRDQGDKHAFQVHVGPMRPVSKGFIALRSKNPSEYPVIQPNYLESEQDRIEMRDSVKITRDIFAQRAFDLFRGEEIRPGSSCTTDKDIDDFVRAKADSAYHPCGTCKMGDDPMSVVNSQAQVHGVAGLRVVDASIMPSIVSGNLNGPTVMMAEKCADHILGNRLLAPSEVPFFDWRQDTPSYKG
ncbi:choline dehydrogenase [Gallaecimonas mangrovi]|uniref:choline dehydrogenase n=1 Tax=Gallaecimonas mangrovi TaxID=2291597 RepID=UPI000E204146|nr:choline dehydrogenase [Gallaecimonas mangrovi]